MKYLSQAHVFGRDQQIVLVLDSGTGTTAIGLALGIIYFGCAQNLSEVFFFQTLLFCCSSFSYPAFSKTACSIAPVGNLERVHLVWTGNLCSFRH